MTISTLKEKNRPVEILLVEDNKGDAILTKKAFESASLKVNIAVAEHGEEAVNMLFKKGEFKNAITPDLILLDLNLPRLNGKVVLADIKKDKKLRHIPVLLLTSSCAEMDVLKSYASFANGYIVKPTDLAKFSELIKAIEAFWFNVVVLPDITDVESTKLL